MILEPFFETEAKEYEGLNFPVQVGKIDKVIFISVGTKEWMPSPSELAEVQTLVAKKLVMNTQL